MSDKLRLPWAEAAEIARDLARDLQVVSRRVKTVGSIRRRKETVGDIELLIEPHSTAPDLFDPSSITAPDVEAIYRVVERWGVIDREMSGDRMIRATMHGRGVPLDLFLCHPPASWGLLLALRTGPADLSQHAVTRLHRFNRRSHKARVEEQREGRIVVVPTPTEADFFAAAGLPCLPPHLRHTREAFRPAR